MRKLFTSESVTEGHPDKVCDRISDAVLDAVLAVDPNGRVACETCCTTDTVFIAGEITSKVDVNIVGIARRVLRDIGYTGGASGFNANTCKIEVAVHKQSPDIAMGTGDDVGGAGDQGMMFGYACSETEQLMPLPIMLAHQMAYRLTQRRKDGTIPFILPDGKTQVTVEYGEDGMPSRIDTIVISTQHYENATEEQLLESLTENVITPILKYAKHFAGVYGGDLDIDTYNLYINPTGRFVQGGPAADTGLTGRKIIVDTYGGYAPHGGGAFSGKDPTKVDRSAAYMARHIAKNVVASGLCDKCQVQLAYAIGMALPVSLRIDTFGANVDEEKLCNAVDRCFELTPLGIIDALNLRLPIYEQTSAYGHFGNVTGGNFTWESTHKAGLLRRTYNTLQETGQASFPVGGEGGEAHDGRFRHGTGRQERHNSPGNDAGDRTGGIGNSH